MALAGAVVFLAVSLFLGSVLQGPTPEDVEDQAVEIRTFATELRDGLVTGCERNGNPIREAVQGMLQEQIEQSRSPAIRKFFPQISPGEFGRLVALANARRRARIKELEPVDCAALYPSP